MRYLLVLVLLALASCAGGAASLSEQAAGLDVADAALASGAPDAALHIAQRILERDPRNVAALVHAGRGQAALGQRNEAIQSFSRALAIAPDNSDATLGLGRLELATDPAGAMALFQRLADRAPPDVNALVDLGIAHDLLGQHRKAQATYRQALAIDPGRMAANVNLGLSLALSGDPDKAVRILRPLAASPNTSPRVRQDLAVALTLAGDSNAAAAILRREIGPSQLAATLATYRLLKPGP